MTTAAPVVVLITCNACPQRPASLAEARQHEGATGHHVTAWDSATSQLPHAAWATTTTED